MRRQNKTAQTNHGKQQLRSNNCKNTLWPQRPSHRQALGTWQNFSKMESSEKNHPVPPGSPRSHSSIASLCQLITLGQNLPLSYRPQLGSPSPLRTRHCFPSTLPQRLASAFRNTPLGTKTAYAPNWPHCLKSTSEHERAQCSLGKKNCTPILPNLTYVNLHIQISIYHPYLGESRASTYSAAAAFGTEREQQRTAGRWVSFVSLCSSFTRKFLRVNLSKTKIPTRLMFTLYKI